jgi:thermitase
VRDYHSVRKLCPCERVNPSAKSRVSLPEAAGLPNSGRRAGSLSSKKETKLRRFHFIFSVVTFLVLGNYLVGSVGEADARTNEDAPSLREAGEQEEYASDRVLVKLKAGQPQEDLERLNRNNGASTEEKIPGTRLNVVDLPADLPVEEAVERYETSPDVEYAEPDFIFKPSQTNQANDPGYPRMWGLNNWGQSCGTADADVDAPDAWSATTGDANTLVAVIDQGVDINHPDLKSNIWTNPGESGEGKETNGVDDDGNGYVDDVNGWDFHNDDASVYDPVNGGPGDQHGTFVAGIIAAEGNNSLGVVGVNWQAKIMVLKILGPNSGYSSDAVEAIDYAVANGAKISNNSWGGGEYSQALLDAINRADAAGHLFVAAAGNRTVDTVGVDTDRFPFYPSSYNSTNIISVAATDNRDTLARFSNYGATSVDLTAPGVGILNTLPNSDYGSFSGTSASTPHVTGAAALIKSEYPSWDNARIKDQILQSVDRRDNLEGKLVSGGRLNAARALGVAVPSPTSTVPSPCTVPKISAPRPAKTRDRTPTISARVWDAETNLIKANVKNVYLDGRRITNFSYNRSTDKLSFRSKRELSYKRHTVRVTAQDPQGLTRTNIGRFRVVR